VQRGGSQPDAFIRPVHARLVASEVIQTRVPRGDSLRPWIATAADASLVIFAPPEVSLGLAGGETMQAREKDAQKTFTFSRQKSTLRLLSEAENIVSYQPLHQPCLLFF
jgi:hypothetical protein